MAMALYILRNNLVASFNLGLYAIPDSPYTTRARWLPEASKQLYIDRMKKIDRRAQPLSWGQNQENLHSLSIYIISLMLM
jgi:ACS family pantothenate transporter-like MFS transporter